MSRRRNPNQIRVDAVKMAIQKAKAGCLTCGQDYLSLAKQHGATDEEVQLAISTAAETIENEISRRDLLKMAAAAAAGIALATVGPTPQEAEAFTTYYGTDSNTQSCCGVPQNFYVGRFGYGTTGSAQYFNTSAANAAGYNNTYEYWGVQGPGSAPGTDPWTWGSQQAAAARYQYTHNANAGYAGGLTIFGDIEPGFGGWSGGNYSTVVF